MYYVGYVYRRLTPISTPQIWNNMLNSTTINYYVTYSIQLYDTQRIIINIKT